MKRQSCQSRGRLDSQTLEMEALHESLTHVALIGSDSVGIGVGASLGASLGDLPFSLGISVITRPLLPFARFLDST